MPLHATHYTFKSSSELSFFMFSCLLFLAQDVNKVLNMISAMNFTMIELSCLVERAGASQQPLCGKKMSPFIMTNRRFFSSPAQRQWWRPVESLISDDNMCLTITRVVLMRHNQLCMVLGLMFHEGNVHSALCILLWTVWWTWASLLCMYYRDKNFIMSVKL